MYLVFFERLEFLTHVSPTVEGSSLLEKINKHTLNKQCLVIAED